MAIQATNLVPLSSLNDEGHVIMPEFWARIGDERVFVTAVLERTVVYQDGKQKSLTRRENCFVDPADIDMRPVSNSLSWRGRGKAVAARPVEAADEPGPEALAEDLESQDEDEEESL
jgi:hypothetical protein